MITYPTIHYLIAWSGGLLAGPFAVDMWDHRGLGFWLRALALSAWCMLIAILNSLVP